MDDTNPLTDNRKYLTMLIAAVAILVFLLILLMKPVPAWQLT